MWHAECPYLVSSKAPAGWQENSSVRKKVEDALKDIEVNSQVKKSLESCAKITKNSATPPSSNERRSARKEMAVSSATGYPKHQRFNERHSKTRLGSSYSVSHSSATY